MFSNISRSHDTSPSILTRPLPDRPVSNEPQNKRQKSDAAVEPTILSRSSSNAYTTLDGVLNDIDAAVSDIMDKLQLSDAATRNQFIPIPFNQMALSTKISGFKKRAHELVRREKASREKQMNIGSNKSYNSNNYLANGNLGSNTAAQLTANSGEKLVLTLYGNAPGPKQLFSSMQRPINVDGETIVQPLREAGLPNGISTTKIIPIQSTGLLDDNNKKRTRTLGEAFPTPATVPPLQPPKPSKVTSSRSSTLSWYHPSMADTSSRSASYFKQPISTGAWLDYSNTTPSPGSKRKRDRTASISGKVPASETVSSELEASKLERLFRSAYSGFAPTKDDAAAIAPEGVMNRLWWQQAGHLSFERLVKNAGNLHDMVVPEPNAQKSAIVDDEEFERIKEAVEGWEDQAIDPNLLSLGDGAEKSIEEKDVEEVLQGISELLETLNAYQRIRHTQLTHTNRPPGLLSAPEAASSGTPTKPGEPEQATYEIIKSQLVLMIAMLPPYAVAKLDSDQLAELSISAKIEIPMEDFKGVMEEDEVAARARAAALSAVSTRPTTGSSVHRTSSAALYGNQYSASRPPATPASQYFASQTPIRPPQTNMQRPPATAPAPYQRTASSTQYRPNAYPGATYAHQAPRPIQVGQQYTANQGQQQYHHTPTQSYSRPTSQTYSTPQSAHPRGSIQYPGQAQPSYPLQVQQQNGTDYRYANGTNIPRQSSPPKPQYTPQPASVHAQTRPAYPTTSAPMAQDRRAYLQNSMNGGSAQSPQPQQSLPQQQYHQPPLGPTNYSTFMTTEQQSSMMERQRAQLAQQQGTQHQARSAAQASASTMGSPTKTQINGSSAVVAGS